MNLFVKNIITLSTFIAVFFSIPITWATDEENVCWKQEGYQLYECRIKAICESYKPKKPIYKKQQYKEAKTLKNAYIGADTQAPALGEAKRIYRENVGNTYKCVIVQAQKNALNFLKDQLDGQVDDTIGRQIEQRINKLDLTANTLKCSLTEKDKFTIKFNLLQEVTYEMCHYVNYLEYLKVFYSDTENSLWLNDDEVNDLYQQEYNTNDIPKVISWIQNEINSEISHTYKVYPLVFHAYSEYENNFPIHFLLEIIHADFLLLRQKMYQTIMPIAQVGYKIINAMSY